MAILNMAFYVSMIVLGSYLYGEARQGKVDGMIGYFGVALSVFALISQTPMMVMLSITLATLTHRFDY